MKRYFLLFSLCSLLGAASAQVKTLRVRPQQTESSVYEVHGPHIAVYDSVAPQRPELVLMIQGTGGTALGCRKWDSTVARMGFHVVSLDYPNDVITTVCSDSPDSACFYGFRQEIVFGTPVSEKVTVDSANCIVRRLGLFLRWLAANDPAGGWGAYLQDGEPRWERIVVAGHSQGAGHAAYLGKKFPLAGVLMLSGPQDYMKPYSRPAPWQGLPGKTPAERQFAFLNLQDPFVYSYQVADVAAVTGYAVTDTTMVVAGGPVGGDRHLFVNDLNTEDHHGSTMNLVFTPLFQFILQRISSHQ